MPQDSDHLRNYYAEDVKRKLGELDQLLDLAEAVSKTLEEGTQAALRQSMLLGSLAAFVSVAVAAGSLAGKALFNSRDDTPYFLAALGTLIILITTVMTIYWTLRSRNVHRSLKIDQRILSDILVMISDLMSQIGGKVSPVEYALLTMRMRRISLSQDHKFI